MSKTAATFTALAAVAALAVAAPTLARQAPPPPPAPTVQAPVTKNPADASAGVYNIDLLHSSVIARIGHGRGLSFSTMRFGVTKAVLNWDPANVANIKLEATVDAKPHYEPIVYRGPPEGENFLNAAKFPTATFVSTGVTSTGPGKADVRGNLTIVGVTKPAVLHLELLGVTKNGQGVPMMGFTGNLEIKRFDFGITANPSVSDAVSLQLDGEFIKAG